MNADLIQRSEELIAIAWEYGQDVLDGTIPACTQVKQAAQRQIDDLERAANDDSFEYYFDVLAAARPVIFGEERCCHTKGEWSGKPIILEPWQVFIVTTIFGWKLKEDDMRRFQTAYIEVARKNGKSTMLSVIGIYLLVADGEPGSEVYCCATKKDQAKIVFDDATKMIKASPLLRRRIGTHRNNIHYPKGEPRNKFEPLASDSNSLDGLNIHGGIIDELHAHKNRDVWDVIETGTGARRQPLLFAITTAGDNQQGICYEQRTYVTKILNGSMVPKDESYFGIIYTLDDGDEWTDKDTWIKSNPNYGVSIKPRDIKRLAMKAKESVMSLNNFLTKRLNVWCNTARAWLNMDEWKSCSGDGRTLADFKGKRCFVGVDLANKIDIAAVVLLFPELIDGKTHYHVFCKFYLPEEAIEIKAKSIGNMYSAWAASGHLTLTLGNVIDHEIIENDLRAVLDEFDVEEVAYDPWGSVQFATRMEADGAPMVEYGQTVKGMSEPMKELEVLVKSKRLHHGNNPVLNWMASNVIAKEDKNENVFPDKENKDNKIDGIIAIITGLGRAIFFEGDNTEPGVIVL